MALSRESSFMPTVKCSSCGDQVEISMMGDHICGSATTSDEPLPPMPETDAFHPEALSPLSQGTKPGRVPPPRVDTGVANRPFMGPSSVTPISTSTGSYAMSPQTPGAGGADGYFQPRIMSDYDASTSPPATRRPGGYGRFDESDGYAATSNYSPVSPRSPKQQEDLLQRMNTITSGPFDIDRRPSQAATRNAFPPSRKESTSQHDVAQATSPKVADSPPLSSSLDVYEPPRTAFGTSQPTSPGTSSVKSGFAFLSQNHSDIAPPQIPIKKGYGRSGPPIPTTDDFEPGSFQAKRSVTFPRPSDPAESPMRTPSAPGVRPERQRQQMPPSAGHNRQQSMGPDRSRPPPPRTSLLRPSTSGRDGPPINLADEFGVGNPYHSPSDSASSGYSTFSRPGDASSRSSSQTSPVKSKMGQRKPSNTSNLHDLMNDLETSIADMGTGRSDFSSPFEETREPHQRPSPPSADPRHDPAVQGSGERRTSPLAPSRLQEPQAVQPLQPPTPPRSTSPRPGSRKHSDAGKKGPCKGCGNSILGKSVSSADGRLTGRYHKPCFVCITCTQPFTSAEFYVLGDRPYCELHYHELNGSLCGSCGRGIEGQYLEDEEAVKYHVGCFRCGDCGMSLSNGYFDVDGKAYCERDAWRRIQPPRMAGAQAPGGTPGRKPSRAPAPPMGLPARPGAGPRPGMAMGPGPGKGGPRPPVGLPRGQRLPPGANLAPMPRMNKRMTRLGMMGPA